MHRSSRDDFGNPSGGHAVARAAKTALEEAREQVAASLGAQPGEVVFTGGGTEADNLAVKGAARAARAAGVGDRRRHHRLRAQGGPRRSATGSRREGFRRGRRRVDPGGVVDLDALAAALDDRTVVVSVMLVNNEVGTIQPLDEVADLVRRAGAAGRAAHRRGAGGAVDRRRRGVGRAPTSSSISAHKFGGPKGVGRARRARRRPARAAARRRRAGAGPARRHRRTSPAPSAWPTALRVTTSTGTTEVARVARAARPARRRARRAGARLRRSTATRSPRSRATATSAFPGRRRPRRCSSLLDRAGVCAAAGSSCTSGATEPSHVLAAMGLAARRRAGLGPADLGYASTEADVDARARRDPRRGRAAAGRPAGAGMSERVLVAMSGGVDSSVAAALLREAGPRRHRRHAQALGRRVRLGVLQRRRRRGRPPGRRPARHPALRLQLHRRLRRARRRALRRRATPPARRPTPASSATARSSSAGCSSGPTPSASTRSPPGTTPGSSATADGLALARGVDRAKDQSYVLYMLGQRRARPRCCCRSASSPRPRCASTHTASASAPPARRRAWRSASSPAAGGSGSCTTASAPRPGPIVDDGRRRGRAARRRRRVHGRAAARPRGRRGGAPLRRRRRRSVGHGHDRAAGAAAPARRSTCATCGSSRARRRRTPTCWSRRGRTPRPSRAVCAATASSSTRRSPGSHPARSWRCTTATGCSGAGSRRDCRCPRRGAGTSACSRSTSLPRRRMTRPNDGVGGNRITVFLADDNVDRPRGRAGDARHRARPRGRRRRRRLRRAGRRGRPARAAGARHRHPHAADVPARGHRRRQGAPQAPSRHRRGRAVAVRRPRVRGVAAERGRRRVRVPAEGPRRRGRPARRAVREVADRRFGARPQDRRRPGPPGHAATAACPSAEEELLRYIAEGQPIKAIAAAQDTTPAAVASARRASSSSRSRATRAPGDRARSSGCGCCTRPSSTARSRARP